MKPRDLFLVDGRHLMLISGRHDLRRNRLSAKWEEVLPQLLARILIVSDLDPFIAYTDEDSASQTYTVSAQNAYSTLRITAPTNYRISLDGTTWLQVLTIAAVNNAIATTTIYVKLLQGTVGTYNGNITHVMTGASENLAVLGTISIPCITLPDGCAVATSTHPRWDEDADHYGTNNLGLSVYAGGSRAAGLFDYIGGYGYLWNSDAVDAANAETTAFVYSEDVVYQTQNAKKTGFNVRVVSNYTGEEEDFAIITDAYTDGDGNKYDAVVLNSKLWCVENLYTTKYQNGSAINNVTDSVTWDGLSTGAYCWYDNDFATYGVYGALYNWFAVNSGLVTGDWRVTSKADWDALIAYLTGLNWCSGEITTDDLAIIFKSCRQINHPLA